MVHMTADHGGSGCVGTSDIESDLGSVADHRRPPLKSGPLRTFFLGGCRKDFSTATSLARIYLFAYELEQHGE